MNLSAFLRFSPLGILLFALGAVVFASPAFAEGGAEPYLDGSAMGLVWATPFAGILLSIAIVPLVAPHFWHSHFGKISAFWALCFLVPFTIVYGFEISLYEVLHILLLEYLPFIILLFALYTVAGGVRLTGSLQGTP
ncbi:MAG: sodium:proton antiporter, partial [Rhodospirillaceae bacterium]|nr:sodium:proton antiporter [Rhodospirillaceae bacterium]